MDDNLESIGKAILHSDENGMIILQCDKCKSKFKLEGSFLTYELGGDIYCPICGISAELSTYYPEELVTAALALAKAHAEELIYKSLNRMNSKYFKVTVPQPVQVDKTIDFKDKDLNMQMVYMKCCDKDISLLPIDLISGYYCPYLGRIIK